MALSAPKAMSIWAVILWTLLVVAIAAGITCGIWATGKEDPTREGTVIIGTSASSAYGVRETKEAEVSGHTQVYAQTPPSVEDGVMVPPDAIVMDLSSADLITDTGGTMTLTVPSTSRTPQVITREGHHFKGTAATDKNVWGEAATVTQAVLRATHVDVRLTSVLGAGSSVRFCLSDLPSGAMKGDKQLVDPGEVPLWLDTETGRFTPTRPAHPASVPKVRDHRGGTFPLSVSLSSPTKVTVNHGGSKETPLFQVAMDFEAMAFLTFLGVSSPTEIVDREHALLRATICPGDAVVAHPRE